MKLNTTTLTCIAVFGALVVVLDYSFKFSGFKILFPWLPFLKFDFTWVPIVLSTLANGLGAGIITSMIAFLAILVRSGDVIGASMKGLAELSTVVVMSLFSIRLGDRRFAAFVSFSLGCITRVAVMVLVNFLILPATYGIPINGVIA